MALAAISSRDQLKLIDSVLDFLYGPGQRCGKSLEQGLNGFSIDPSFPLESQPSFGPERDLQPHGEFSRLVPPGRSWLRPRIAGPCWAGDLFQFRPWRVGFYQEPHPGSRGYDQGAHAAV